MCNTQLYYQTFIREYGDDGRQAFEEVKCEYESGFLDDELSKQFIVRGCITSLPSVVSKFDDIKSEALRRLKEERIVSGEKKKGV